MTDCYEYGCANVIDTVAQVAFQIHQFVRLDGNYLWNRRMKWIGNLLKMLLEKKPIFLPNLSKTDGPAGGCCGIGVCLLFSYFDGYETVWCDGAPYGVCFGIFNGSSWSSSSLGNAYFEADASFLLNSKKNTIIIQHNCCMENCLSLPFFGEHLHFPFTVTFFGLLAFSAWQFLFSEKMRTMFYGLGISKLLSANLLKWWCKTKKQIEMITN